MADTNPPFTIGSFSITAVQGAVAMTTGSLIPITDNNNAVVNLTTENLGGVAATLKLIIAPGLADDLSNVAATVTGTATTTGAVFSITNTVANTLLLGSHRAIVTSTDQLGNVQVAATGTVIVLSAN